MIGCAFTIGISLVSWKTILQDTMDLSTMEEEYKAEAEVVKEGIQFKGLISNLGGPQEKVIISATV